MVRVYKFPESIQIHRKGVETEKPRQIIGAIELTFIEINLPPTYISQILQIGKHGNLLAQSIQFLP